MKSLIKSFFIFAILFLLVNSAAAQLPQEAICSVCRVNEGETGPEKVVDMSEYLGEKFYFCSKKCQGLFDADPEAYTPPVLPRPAPGFAVKNLAGEKISLATLAGKVVLLDFWATWCKPCVKSMPELQKLHEQLAPQGLTIVGISIDEQGQKKVPAFLARHKITYPVALDGGETPAWESYKVKVIPALFLIDRKGRIVQQWIGEARMEEVTKAVRDLLQVKAE